jgi:hypothetical protein
MRQIWKYEINIGGEVVHEMPLGAEFLALQMQYGAPTLWVAVDSDRPKLSHRFRFFGTGHELPAKEKCTYLGTVQVAGGAGIAHLYELL